MRAREATLNTFVLAGTQMREALFQPLADRLARATGVGCFTAAALLITLRTVLDWGADLMVAGGLDAVRPPGSVAPWRDGAIGLCGLAVALHLLRFQARTRRLDGPVVHPYFHGRYFTGWMAVIAVLNALPIVGGLQAWLTRPVAGSTLVQAAYTFEYTVATVGLFLASCVRRRPPPKRRTQAAPGRLAPARA